MNKTQGIIVGVIAIVLVAALLISIIGHMQQSSKIKALQTGIKADKARIVTLQLQRDQLTADRDKIAKGYGVLVNKLSAQTAKKKAIKLPATESEIKQRFENLGYKSR